MSASPYTSMRVSNEEVYKVEGATEEEHRRAVARILIGWIGMSALRDSNSCVVFDIQEIIIDDSGHVLHSMVEVYRYCLQESVPIYIITARPESSWKTTTTRFLSEEIYSWYMDV